MKPPRRIHIIQVILIAIIAFILGMTLQMYYSKKEAAVEAKKNEVLVDALGYELRKCQGASVISSQ